MSPAGPPPGADGGTRQTAEDVGSPVATVALALTPVIPPPAAVDATTPSAEEPL
jgi:hypothetical protein